MLKLPFKILAVTTAVIFAVAALFCCYNHPAFANASAVKNSCCDTKTKNSSSKTDCSACPIVQKSVDLAAPFTLKDTVSHIKHALVPLEVKAPKSIPIISSLWEHGPPDGGQSVARYVQFHSLRL